VISPLGMWRSSNSNSTTFELWTFSTDSKFVECFKRRVVECEFVEKSLFYDWFPIHSRFLGFISITQCRAIDRAFVDLAISRRPDVVRCHTKTHARQHAVRLTMRNGDNYLDDGHFMSPERPWLDGHSATERRRTRAQCCLRWWSLV